MTLAVKLILGAGVGLAAGALIGYVGKCRSGTCPLTANPLTGALFGALLGAAVAFSFRSGGSAHEAMARLRAVETSEDFERQVLGAERPVVVDFYQDGCPPCDALAPTLAALADDYAGRIDFAKVNVRRAGDLAVRYGVEGTPTVVLFDGGAAVRRWLGNRPASEFRPALDAAAPAAPRPTTQETTP